MLRRGKFVLNERQKQERESRATMSQRERMASQQERFLVQQEEQRLEEGGGQRQVCQAWQQSSSQQQTSSHRLNWKKSMKPNNTVCLVKLIATTALQHLIHHNGLLLINSSMTPYQQKMASEWLHGLFL